MRNRINKALWIVLAVALLAMLVSGCQKPTYTVTFDLNGGELVSGSLTQTVEKGSAAQAPEVKNGSRELTWDTDFSKIKADTTVTAQWGEAFWDVTFDLNGGELVSGELTQTVDEGTAATPPEATNGRMTLTWDSDYEHIMGDTTITAVWEKVAMSSTELAEYVRERTVTVNVKTITGGSSAGSGFFIDDQGTIVTNYHVIDMGASMSVQFTGGGSYDVREVVDFSPVYDLAILKIDLTGNPYLDICADPAKVGEKVYAVGSALGTLDGSFTEGTVSSTDRKVASIDCIQMDAAISHGNSGGPLVNVYGEVVGVNTYSYTAGESLNLAIKPVMLDKLTLDKHYTVNDFKEWYDRESARSYSPYLSDDVGQFFYSIINTYQQVTGAECVVSEVYASPENTQYNGYRDCCNIYIYNYDSAQFDQYVGYLKSLGFEYKDNELFDGGTSYYYYHPRDGYLMDLFVRSDSPYIQIYPTFG